VGSKGCEPLENKLPHDRNIYPYLGETKRYHGESEGYLGELKGGEASLI